MTRSNSADFNRATTAKPDPGPARKLTEPSGVRFTVAHQVGLSADGEASCAIISKTKLTMGYTLLTSADGAAQTGDRDVRIVGDRVGV